jgi:hypothetical protein
MSVLGDVGLALKVIGEGFSGVVQQMTQFEKAMRDLTAAMNRDIYGPPDVVRTVAEEEVDFSSGTA